MPETGRQRQPQHCACHCPGHTLSVIAFRYLQRKLREYKQNTRSEPEGKAPDICRPSSQQEAELEVEGGMCRNELEGGILVCEVDGPERLEVAGTEHAQEMRAAR